ncbi:MAG: hypothetical protein AB7S75_09705 [Desulfococcaceae bacterium]
MEELLELKTFIQKGQYEDALFLIGEMEEMSRDDKNEKLFNYLNDVTPLPSYC